MLFKSFSQDPLIFHQRAGKHEGMKLGLETLVITIAFRLPDSWLVVSMHPEDPVTGHLDTGFIGFPLSLSKF
jgi:hypothetical protein